ncbi:MAG TPA: hypothetical protein DDW55_09845, partial [Gammaproteobacteria bacterium]|nr:hypothetical protein [Gammaproteobacteria bacterium]
MTEQTSSHYPVHGAGIGLRRSVLDEFMQHPDMPVDFMEVAPENWIGIGGKFGKKFRYFTERFPFIIHGLSLSIGGPEGLDENFVREVRDFIR